MTIKRLEQIVGLLGEQFCDELDLQVEEPLLEASRIVGQELTDWVSTDRLPYEALAIYTELISLYLNASLMTCLKATREVAALTRPMIEGAIILSQLVRDKDGSFLEELKANAYSGSTWPPIPVQTDHLFHSKLTSHSGANCPLIPVAN